MHERDPRDVLRGCDDLIHLPGIGIGITGRPGPVNRDIARSLRPYLRCAFAHGLPQVDHGSALLVVEDDKLGGVLGFGRRVRDHQGDGLADVPDCGPGERRAMRNDQFLSASTGHRRVLRHTAGPFHVCCGENGKHPGSGARRSGVDGSDASKGMQRANEITIGLTAHSHVIRKAAAAAYQRIILQAWLMLRLGCSRLCIHVTSGCSEVCETELSRSMLN